MSNLTGLVNELLHQRDSGAVCGGRYTLQNINEFLKQAYSINSRLGELVAFLRSIRQPYLSTAPPPRRKQAGPQHVYYTNAQRDTIDAEAKSTLRDLHAAVSALSDAEQTRYRIQEEVLRTRRKRNGLGALGQWASGGAQQELSPADAAADATSKMAKAHHESVIWFLQRKLEECSRIQGSMMEIRITREIERGKSVLHKAGGVGGAVAGTDAGLDTSAAAAAAAASRMDDDTSQQLSQDQVQLFEEENRNMLKHYQDRLDQVRTAEKSLVEISELQSTLASNLEVQQAHIDQLTQDSFFASENVEGGNKQLKRASERRNMAQAIFYSSCGVCLFLIGWDLVF